MKMNIQFFADELLGTWVFKEQITIPSGYNTYNLDFTSPNNSAVSGDFALDKIITSPSSGMEYSLKDFGETIYIYDSNSGWADGNNIENRTIIITDVSNLSNREEFITWFSANSNFKPKPKSKDVKLKDGDIQLFPQTKASLLVNDDGTPYTPTLPQATSNTLGGVKAKPSTTEDTQEVHINSSGELVTKASSGGGGGTKLYRHNVLFTTEKYNYIRIIIYDWHSSKLDFSDTASCHDWLSYCISYTAEENNKQAVNVSFTPIAFGSKAQITSHSITLDGKISIIQDAVSTIEESEVTPI